MTSRPTTWHPHFNVKYQGQTFHTVSPYDFATIYNVLPLWKRGFTGKGVTIALVEDSNLAHESDWYSFRKTFGLNGFKDGNFKQIYPNCTEPRSERRRDRSRARCRVGERQRSRRQHRAFRVRQFHDRLRARSRHPQSSRPRSARHHLRQLWLLRDHHRAQTEIALENREAQIATALGTTFFIAQGDTGADECSPVEGYLSHLGINSGDNTASAYAVDVGGTDFMAQYNADVNGIPVSDYWSATNDPVTKASALSYIPEIPWNDGCTSELIYSDPVFGGGYTQVLRSLGILQLEARAENSSIR